MKKVRVLAAISQEAAEKPQVASSSDVLVFYNKTTGTTQFSAKALSGEQETIERAAGSLAIQCLVRGQDPDNFLVLVPATDVLSGRLVARAKELLDQGRSLSEPTTLSPRQKEILESVVKQQANKEIASRLNITVRTVKFHISSLLSKFGVQTRWELAQKASRVFGLANAQPGPFDAADMPDFPQAFAPMAPLVSQESSADLRGARTVRFPGRMRTA